MSKLLVIGTPGEFLAAIPTYKITHNRINGATGACVPLMYQRINKRERSLRVWEEKPRHMALEHQLQSRRLNRLRPGRIAIQRDKQKYRVMVASRQARVMSGNLPNHGSLFSTPLLHVTSLYYDRYAVSGSNFLVLNYLIAWSDVDAVMLAMIAPQFGVQLVRQ